MNIEENETRSCIDWEQAVYLTGGKYSLAKELLSMFINAITEELPNIQALYEQRKLMQLHDIIHQLHGSVSYCGLPALKQAINLFETAIKLKNEANITKAYENFLNETTRLQKEYAAMRCK